MEVVGDLHELIRRDQEKRSQQKLIQSTTTYRIAKHTIQGVTYGELEYQCWTSKMDYGFMGVFVHKREGSLAFQMYVRERASCENENGERSDDYIVDSALRSSLSVQLSFLHLTIFTMQHTGIR